jgi:hypothetical protein
MMFGNMTQSLVAFPCNDYRNVIARKSRVHDWHHVLPVVSVDNEELVFHRLLSLISKVIEGQSSSGKRELLVAHTICY